jgi:hypothetical protein
MTRIRIWLMFSDDCDVVCDVCADWNTGRETGGCWAEIKTGFGASITPGTLVGLRGLTGDCEAEDVARTTLAGGDISSTGELGGVSTGA